MPGTVPGVMAVNVSGVTLRSVPLWDRMYPNNNHSTPAVLRHGFVPSAISGVSGDGRRGQSRRVCDPGDERSGAIDRVSDRNRNKVSDKYWDRNPNSHQHPH